MVVNKRAKGNRIENQVKKYMESIGFVVEKQRPKYRFAAGNSDFFGVFDLICIPTNKCKYDDIIMLQVKSRKQYGVEKNELKEFVNKTKEIYKAAFVWPKGKGRNKTWEFEYIKKEGSGQDIILSEKDI